jgi:hypothetical protein
MSLKRLLILLSVVFTAAACGPIVMLPGGKLDGTVVAAPNDWGFSDATKTVQLETRPSDPYSVNIWIIAMGSDLYVHAGDNRATWVDHLEAYERARIGDDIYALQADRVSEQSKFDQFSDAYEKKYDRRPGNENVGEVYLYRLKAPD